MEYIKPGVCILGNIPEGHIPHIVDGLWCAVKIPVVQTLEEAITKFKEGYCAIEVGPENKRLVSITEAEIYFDQKRDIII